MSKYEPIPMLEDASEPSYVRELLEAGRADRVTDYDYTQGLSLHMGHVEAGTPPPDWAQSLPQTGPGAGAGAAGAAGAGVAAVPLAAWIAVPVVTAGVVAAVMLGGEPVPAPVQQLEVPTVVSPAGAELEVDSALPTVAAEPAAEPTMAAAPTVAAEVDVEVDDLERAADGERPAQRRHGKQAVPARPAVTAEPAPVELPSVKVTSDEPSAPSRPRSAARRAQDLEDVLREPPPSVRVSNAADEPVAARAEPVRQEPAERDDASLEREMRMLAVAQRVLRSDPSRALRLAKQGEREFPDTMFTQERRQLLLLALIELGRTDEARRLAGPYLKQYPKGPFSDRVRRALVTGRVER